MTGGWTKIRWSAASVYWAKVRLGHVNASLRRRRSISPAAHTVPWEGSSSCTRELQASWRRCLKHPTSGFYALLNVSMHTRSSAINTHMTHSWLSFERERARSLIHVVFDSRRSGNLFRVLSFLSPRYSFRWKRSTVIKFFIRLSVP